MLVNALIQKWHAKQLDFVQAFPQAPIAKTQFVELPKGITIKGVNSSTHVFEVLRNIYGGKDAGRQWFLHLKKHLLDIGFTQSQHDSQRTYGHTRDTTRSLMCTLVQFRITPARTVFRGGIFWLQITLGRIFHQEAFLLTLFPL